MSILENSKPGFLFDPDVSEVRESEDEASLRTALGITVLGSAASPRHTEILLERIRKGLVDLSVV